MNANNIEMRFRENLALFGLNSDYTLEELSTSYRTLAKLNHPDITGNSDSPEKMALINDGYSFLKDVLHDNNLSCLRKVIKEDKAEDVYYSQYKKAFTILKNAFEDFFGESQEKKLFRDEAVLKENLINAKKEFSKLVNDLPYNEWVNDAIDKISSINRWLD